VLRIIPQGLMPNWHTRLLSGLSGPGDARLGSGTPAAELRRPYSEIAARFGLLPAETTVERAHLGQVKGEWVRVPEAQPERLILYFHGGGYVAGSPESHRPLIARLCKAAGAGALTLDYRLAPEFPFPACLRDAVDAYRFLIGKGFPPLSIALAGDGAGGGLAISTAMAIRNAQMPMPAAVVAMSPWADLTLSGWSMMENAASDDVLSWDLLFVSARNYLKNANPADPYASPVFGNMRDFPPIMVHTGSLEILRDDASRLGELAAAANVPVSVEVYHDMGHLFQALSSSSEGKVSLGRLGQFIRTKIESHARAPELRESAKREAKTQGGS
jgi:monoterpene epsilon-lactone hydrolase